ncbi:MAG: GntR family transcriptional regulator [Clostridia bacterium]|nr:GntR family transcriptional regulator [Clostridia bacterium]
MINLDYKDGRSIHEQIEAGLKELIINGILKTDEQLPSVRELSVSLTVNPNTVQRAYKELEQEGFIYSVKGKGNFVASLSRANSERRRDELVESLVEITRELCFLGLEKTEAMNIIENIYSEREEML